jgi:Amt family ammonium transporter
VVQPVGALALGGAAAIICYGAIILKGKLKYDDSLDAFGIHGVGGIVGSLLLVFFIRDSWMTSAAEAAGGTWSMLQQFGVQAAAVGIAIAYAATITMVIIIIVNKTVGFRASTEAEMQGLDHTYHGEQGYGMLNPR